MSKFFKPTGLTPYTPGEQPKTRKFNKLNTNESPFPPSPWAQKLAREAAENLQLYSDPECTPLVNAAEEFLGIKRENIIFTNGSDEALNFAFIAFCERSENIGVVFPNITYGFYTVFADINNIKYREIPLKEDFSININDYKNAGATIFIANPNAPTGRALSLSEIEEIVASNKESIVVIDEAYVDFGGESAIPLTKKYDNLLVVQTFSKSRSLAGGRLGFAVGAKELINDLNVIKYSTNPYNINTMTMWAGVGALKDREYFEANCAAIIKNREFTVNELEGLGFTVVPSKANFVFAKHNSYDGGRLYKALKEEKDILVRHFDKPLLKDYNRISIGSLEQMTALINALKEILQ